MHIVNAKVYFHNVNRKVSKENIFLFLSHNNNPYIVLVISASYKNKQQK